MTSGARRGELDRRTLLRLAGASVLLAGCQGTDPSSPEQRTSPLSRRPRSSPSPTPPPLPPPYVPLAGEVVPDCKQTAADFVQALTTGDTGGVEAAVARATAWTGTGFDAAQATALARPLFRDEVTRGEIVYPQIGGLVPLGDTARTAAVMVLVRHRSFTREGRTSEEVRLCDVRLAIQEGRWRVVELASVGGEPVDRPASVDPRAAKVLDDPRIELPDTARWDVHAGRISLDLLDVLAAAAAQAPVSVTVLRTGHPRNVFGSTRTSDHTQGRAVDLWRIGGQPVLTTGAADGPSGLVLRTAFADPRLSQAGSPVGSDLDGSGRRRSFVNLVHKDHLHLAARGGSARPTE